MNAARMAERGYFRGIGMGIAGLLRVPAVWLRRPRFSTIHGSGHAGFGVVSDHLKLNRPLVDFVMPVGVLIVSRDGCATGFPRPRAWLPRSVRSRQCVALFYLMMLGRSPGWRRIWSEPRHSLRRTRRTCPGKNEVRGEEASVRDKLLNPVIGRIADFDAVLPGFFPPDVARVAW